MDLYAQSILCMEEHKKAFENWEEGNIKKCWSDTNGNICIRYDSGKMWNYKNNCGQIEWW